MPSFRSLLSATTALSLATVGQTRPLTDAAQADCSCYKATADATAVFANRKFFDFRNIANPVTPAPIVGRDPDAAAGPAHPYFSTAEWSDTWGVQNWATPGEGVYRVNSANNVLIAPADGDGTETGSSHLTLRTQRQSDYQSTAEVESRATDYQFLTVRMLARSRGASGAVTALFTYVAEGDAVQYVYFLSCSVLSPFFPSFSFLFLLLLLLTREFHQKTGKAISSSARAQTPTWCSTRTSRAR